jgi:hypothetical protein
MANPDNIVTVNITIQDAAVSQAGFGTPMILTYEAAFGPELVRSYSSTTAMVTDGHAAAGATVAAATAVFAQNPKVPTLKIGRRETTPTTMTRIMTVASVVDDTDYTVTLNGTAFTIDSGSSATNLTIAAALVAAINGGTEPVTATDNVDGTFDLEEDVDGVIFGLSHTITLLTQDDTTAEAGIATDYAGVKAEDNDFYGVMMTSSATLEIAALAAAVEADRKIFVAQSADSDILSDTAGNLAETLNTAAYDRTAGIFNQDNFDYANAAWIGVQFPKNPGRSTWAFKSLAGVAVDTLTDTQIGNLEGNEFNHYTATKGLNMTLQGTMASGRFIDVTQGIDWLTVSMQERMLQLLANSDKIAYTQSGITALENAVRAQLQEAAGPNFAVITDDFTVTPPDIDDISDADKANRVLGNLNFSATLAGGIHTVTINGSVSV